MFCMFGTFEEDIAVRTFEWFHHVVFGHHMVVRAVARERTIEKFPDGSVWDCLNPDFYDDSDLGPQAALFNATEPGLVRGRMALEEDQAVLISAGTRYIVQSHFVNVTDRDLYLQDVLHFSLIPLERVERPVGTWTFTTDDFAVPPGSAEGVGHSCSVPRELFFSMVMVHMHGYATHFTSELTGGEHPNEEFFNVSNWQPDWRYFFPAGQFDPGIVVPAERKVKYTCYFENSEDTPPEWPKEMCVFEGLAYPLYRPLICNRGVDNSAAVVDEFDFEG
jgi:hypothetical protein